MHSQVYSPRTQRLLDLSYEEAIAPYLAQGAVLHYIPFSGDVLDLDVQIKPQFQERCANYLGLGESKLAGTCADSQGASLGVIDFHNLLCSRDGQWCYLHKVGIAPARNGRVKVFSNNRSQHIYELRAGVRHLRPVEGHAHFGGFLLSLDVNIEKYLQVVRHKAQGHAHHVSHTFGVERFQIVQYVWAQPRLSCVACA